MLARIGEAIEPFPALIMELLKFKSVSIGIQLVEVY
jgi:hypothetical protein